MYNMEASLTFLGNAEAIVDLCVGHKKHNVNGITLTITGTGEQTEAAVVAKTHLPGLLCVVQGPKAGSDIDALLVLHEEMKLVLARAKSMTTTSDYGDLIVGFRDFADLLNEKK